MDKYRIDEKQKTDTTIDLNGRKGEDSTINLSSEDGFINESSNVKKEVFINEVNIKKEEIVQIDNILKGINPIWTNLEKSLYVYIEL